MSQTWTGFSNVFVCTHRRLFLLESNAGHLTMALPSKLRYLNFPSSLLGYISQWIGRVSKCFARSLVSMTTGSLVIYFWDPRTSFSEPFIVCVGSINIEVIGRCFKVDRKNSLDLKQGQRDFLTVVDPEICEVVESSSLKTEFTKHKWSYWSSVNRTILCTVIIAIKVLLLLFRSMPRRNIFLCQFLHVKMCLDPDQPFQCSTDV